MPGIIGDIGAPSPPPPASHRDPRKEDEVEDADAGERREEEANADAIVALVVPVEAAKLIASRRRKGVIVNVTSTVVIVVEVKLSGFGGVFGAALVHGSSLVAATSAVQFCTKAVHLYSKSWATPFTVTNSFNHSERRLRDRHATGRGRRFTHDTR